MPKPDATPADELNDGIDEAIRIGWIAEVSPGQYALTPEGWRREQAEALFDQLSVLIDAIHGKNELRVGLNMCAVAMEQARDFIAQGIETASAAETRNEVPSEG